MRSIDLDLPSLRAQRSRIFEMGIACRLVHRACRALEMGISFWLRLNGAWRIFDNSLPGYREAKLVKEMKAQQAAALIADKHGFR